MPTDFANRTSTALPTAGTKTPGWEPPGYDLVPLDHSGAEVNATPGGADRTAIKDEDSEHPLATTWRPVLRQVVQALAAHDYALANGVEGVEPVSGDVATQMREYIESYGATLIDLPEETWRSSVAQWMGSHWDVLVDLWTAEEGSSDLVLRLNVSECESRYRFEIEMVYVP